MRGREGRRGEGDDKDGVVGGHACEKVGIQRIRISSVVSQQDRITARSYHSRVVSERCFTMNQDQRGRICGDKVGGC